MRNTSRSIDRVAAVDIAKAPGWCAPGPRTRPGPARGGAAVWTVKAQMGPSVRWPGS